MLGAELISTRLGTPSNPIGQALAEEVFNDEAQFQSMGHGGLDQTEELPYRDSECESICSSEQSNSSSIDVEEAAPDESDDESDEAATACRAARGTYVMHSNGYFTFTDHPNTRM